MDASVDLFASAPVKITIVNLLATLALAASKIALLLLPPSTTSTSPSLNYRVPAKDAAGTSTNPNDIVNVPPLDNVHTTATKKGRASGAKTGSKCKMRPSATNNGRNLCAFRWLRQIKINGTTEEFNLYYSSLTPIQRTV
ncbi:hypothetical protein K503DRAFT_343220 [Rhizopogon vinicolor AM-OR11-026]|uniref:Uncharacterized protein n=1 Tax=Rhizopogon vinicolor AM-OR11-026 TaxID=1314800 RepID=A0A1B7MTH0_9AGAM|nr:hypothetical protein K503DRAFT_343220 [Rhizopogon vinicolor AM-OR11-026]